jgi:hypothetical protein
LQWGKRIPIAMGIPTLVLKPFQYMEIFRLQVYMNRSRMRGE